MKPFSMNLSKVKKISGDKDHSVFQHPEGHKITVAHAALSPSHRAQMMKLPIQKLAEGDEDVQTIPIGSGVIPNTAIAEAQQTPDIGPIDVWKQMHQDELNAENNQNITYPPPAYTPSKMPDYVPERNNDPNDADNNPVAQEMVATADQANQDIDEDSDNSDEPIETSNQSATPETASQPQDALSTTQEIAKLATPNLKKVVTEGNSAYIDSANADIKRAKKVAAIEAGLYNAPNKVTGPNGQPMSYRQRSEQIENAMKTGAINYDTVLGGAAGHIAGAIGLILGGAGGRGQGNQALDTLNHRVDQAVQSQKNSNENTMNLWKMNQTAYQNDVAATAAAKGTLLQAAKAKLEAATAQTQDLQARQAGINGLNGLTQSILQQNAIKSYQTFFNGAQGPKHEEDYNNMIKISQFADPALAQSLLKNYIPSVGYSLGPIDDASKKEVLIYKDMQDKLNQAAQLQAQAGKLGTSRITNPVLNRQLVDMQAGLIDDIHNLSGIGRMSDAQVELNTKRIGGLGSPNLGGPAAGIKDLQAETAMKQKNLFQQHGINLFDGSMAHKPGERVLIKGQLRQIINSAGDTIPVK